jgi:hypothetical protein
MGAVTPTLTVATAGYTVPNMPSVYGGVNAGGASLITNGTHHANANDLDLQIYFFASVDNGSTWASGIPGIVALAVQGDDIDTDRVAATLTDAASGAVEFGSENGTTPCWVWVLRRN